MADETTDAATTDQETAITTQAESTESGSYRSYIAGNAKYFGSVGKEGVGKAASREFNNENRTNAHRLVATGMLVTFVVVAIKQDWWKHLRDFIAAKTHGTATATPPGGSTAPPGQTSDVPGQTNPSSPVAA